VSSAQSLPYPDDSFDVAYFRTVLHHMDDPVAALREALRVAPLLLVIEPNGYNPGVKVIERCSSYHIEHEEKSFAPKRLDRWVGEVGGEVVSRQWVGLVPMFSPDWVAKITHRVEPVLERLPVLRAVGCAVYVFTVVRSGAHPPTGLTA
jgi:SAM-dependent methyltransferase